MICKTAGDLSCQTVLLGSSVNPISTGFHPGSPRRQAHDTLSSFSRTSRIGWGFGFPDFPILRSSPRVGMLVACWQVQPRAGRFGYWRKFTEQLETSRIVAKVQIREVCWVQDAVDSGRYHEPLIGPCCSNRQTLGNTSAPTLRQG
jgi:hypothetical protein